MTNGIEQTVRLNPEQQPGHAERVLRNVRGAAAGVVEQARNGYHENGKV
jgi:hypothetical protein